MKKAYIILTLLLAATLFACVKEPQISINDIEQQSLKAWIEKYHPEIKDNYQQEGGYYVEVLNKGILDSLPVTGKDVWVWYDFTARDLHGNVVETRNWELANQLNSYTNYTHYVPAFRFSGADSHSMMEGTYLATFNKLTVRDTESGQMVEMEVRYGTELRLYLPSSVTTSDTSTGDGGYEGEFTMDNSRPIIVDMLLYGHVGNPVAYEGNRVDAFAKINGGLCAEHKAEREEETTTNSARRRHVTRADEQEEEIDTRPLEFFDGRWHQPTDSLEHLYVNYAYSPATTTFDFNVIGTDSLMYPQENIYDAGKIYGNNNLSEIDRRINEALVERFGRGITYDEVLEADSLNANSSAKVWYIGRFLDGYIFDTNIDEVKEIIYGEVVTPGSALTFATSEPLDNDYILAWNYALPTLRYGQWATILTASTYAYGYDGQVGSHTSTTTNTNAQYDMMNYYNYMNYMNSYYGYNYGGMYNSGYYGYNPYYYGYDYTYDSDSTVTITTTSTEIPSFAPLIFQVFIEKNE